MRNLLIIFLFLLASLSWSQELNCSVTVISQFTGNDNNVVFKTLEKQLTEFVNNTKWTDKTFSLQERISCNMVLNIKSYENDAFSATLQVSSSRPVFNSSYSTPIYNYNDKTFNFKYLEFQNLVYNPQQFESNLISVLAFHVHVILGLDADSFAPNGGDEYLSQAQNIANYSQQLNGQGWKLEDGLQSRFALIDNLMSPTFKAFRSALYNYHINGLDVMASDTKASKEAIVSVFSELLKLHNSRPNSFLMRVFFDAKADEISDLLSGGPSIKIASAINTLNRIAPIHAQKWRKIRF